MNEPVEVRTLDPRVVAFHRRQSPYTDIPRAIDDLFAWVTRQGLAPSMVVGTRYFSDPRDTPPAWEAFVEVTPPSAPPPQPGPNDDFGVRELPAVTVAATVHRGPYDGLRRAYERLEAWLAANGYVGDGPPEEVYVSAPDVPLAESVTEVRMPVRRSA